MELFKKYNLISHNFTNNDIKVYENVFSPIDQESINEHIRKSTWSWGHTSKRCLDMKKTTPFWYMGLDDEKFFNEYLFNKIQKIVGEELILHRCYANGNTFGLPGEIHQDGTEDNHVTFLYYANSIWSHEYGGKTTFIFENDLENKYVLPAKNRGVYFPALIPHYAEEITRLYAGLRTVVAWKMEKK